MIQTLRAGTVLGAFAIFTLALIPVQWTLLKLGSRHARTFPRWYHRQVCKLFNLKVHTRGHVADERGVLIVSNHVSWLDIPALSAIAPLSFVAKKEVEDWPFVGLLAGLQRSVFVDRERKSSAHGTSNEIMDRLARGDHVVLFAEGTSSDGNRVLPFKSSLLGAAKPGKRQAEAPPLYVQTFAVAYTQLHGLPIGRALRPRVAWYGDMELLSHAWQVLKGGPIDAHVIIGEPVLLDRFADRKELTRHVESQIRHDFLHVLRRGNLRNFEAQLPQSIASKNTLCDSDGLKLDSNRTAD